MYSYAPLNLSTVFSCLQVLPTLIQQSARSRAWLVKAVLRLPITRVSLISTVCAPTFQSYLFISLIANHLTSTFNKGRNGRAQGKRWLLLASRQVSCYSEHAPQDLIQTLPGSVWPLLSYHHHGDDGYDQGA